MDLSKHVKIPKYRPDLVVTSEKKKILGMMELTVIYENRIEVSGEAKESKYQEIFDAG